MRLRILQERRQCPRLAKFPLRLAKRHLTRCDRLFFQRVTGCAVQLLVQRLPCRDTARIHWNRPDRLPAFQRTEIGGDRTCIRLGCRAVQHGRHFRAWPQLLRVQHPVGHPVDSTPRADPFKRGRVHRQLRHATPRRIGGVALETPMFRSQLPTSPQRHTLGQGLVGHMLEVLRWDRFVAVVGRRPVQSKKGVPFFRRREGRLERVAAGVKPDALGRIGHSSRT